MRKEREAQWLGPGRVRGHGIVYLGQFLLVIIIRRYISTLIPILLNTLFYITICWGLTLCSFVFYVCLQHLNMMFSLSLFVFEFSYVCLYA